MAKFSYSDRLINWISSKCIRQITPVISGNVERVIDSVTFMHKDSTEV